MRADKQDRPASWLPARPVPLLASLALLVVAAVFAWFGFWRRAALMVAAAMFLAGALRLILPTRLAGLLVLRRRWIDVTVMFALGVAIVVVAFVVPRAK